MADQKLTGDVVVRQQRFAVLTSRFNEFITDRLRQAAIDTLLRHGCAKESITEAWVPGAFELPQACRWLAGSGKFDLIVALGAVIRGATSHFDHVLSAARSPIIR